MSIRFSHSLKYPYPQPLYKTYLVLNSMDTRNVQQTGEMLYLYLPTRWCKRFNLSAKSKIGIHSLPNGSLSLYPESIEKKSANLSFRVQSDETDSLYKLIVA